jgi:glucose-6-phosphate 1-dehydrogenase
VQITMAEDVGIGTRAAFYEETGAARDVLQNHLLQLLALTAMEEPVGFDAESLRSEKRKVLGALKPPTDLERYAVRGQYDQGWLAGERVKAYRAEKGVRRTAAPRPTPRSARGRDAPLGRGAVLPADGKRLPARVTEIAVLFRKAPHLPFAKTDTEELGSNQLVVRVQPDEGVTLRFGSKVPGTTMEVRDVAMDFQYGEAFTVASPRRTSGCCWTSCSATPRCSRATRRSRRAGASSTRSRRTGPSRRPRRAAAPVPRRRVGSAGRRRDAGRDGRVWRRP